MSRLAGGAGQGRPLLVALLLACLAWAPQWAHAQPLAADGGWARPAKVASGRPAATVGVAVVEGGVTLAWADLSGVWTASMSVGADGGPSTGAPTQVVAAQNVRAVSAGQAAGELAVAWAERDRDTGRYHHSLWWRGEVRPLFDDPLEVGFGFVTLAGVPYAAATLRRDAEARLTLIPLDGEAEQIVLHRTPLSVRGATYAQAEDGGLWLAWLEGKTERTELGINAEWNASVTKVGGDGSVSPVLTLGKADVTDERQRAAVGAAPGGAVVAWTDEEGALRVARVAEPTAVPAPAAAPMVTGMTAAGAVAGSGRPLAVAWPHLYWAEASAFRRVDVAGLLDAPAMGATVTNVLWSPVTIEGAELAFGEPGEGPLAVGASQVGDEPPQDGSEPPQAGGGERRAVTVIAWYGRAEGGAVELYASDDREPMRVTWQDRLARLMEWNPWYLWEQAIGQALTALLVGVIGVVAAVPYLLIASPLAARSRGGRSSPRRSGLLVGALPVIAASVALAAAGAYGGSAPLAAIGSVALALVVGLGLGLALTRKGDREPQATILLAGALAVFGSLTVWAFVAYPSWAPLVGLA